ncbi:hypothetical protein RUM43_009216 [Polyplax serrata]|uniref:receptor protein-tyrosine kinase n=1 Tax=Polyplax serrata TaxID=468196 RepID=A0AAN8P7P2_POLSC
MLVSCCLGRPQVDLDLNGLGTNASVEHQGAISRNEMGHEIILRCVVDGNGEIKYDWFRNNEQLVKFKGKRIHIKDVSPSNNGVYRCRAHNEAASVESGNNFPLKIQGTSYPQIKVLPKDKLVKRGADVMFDCSYENADDLRWLFENEVIAENERRILKSNGSLLLKDVTSADEGFYICQGVKRIDKSNEKVQSFAAKLRLGFIEDLTLKSLEPIPPDSGLFITREMRPFEIACIPPRALPPATIWWEDETGKTVSSSEKTNSLLIFEYPRVDKDKGNYTCFAENLAGITNTTIQLMVSVPPVVPSDTEAKAVDEGDSFSLPCSYKGSPYPATTVKWKKDKKYINHGRLTVNKTNSSLTIRQVQPSDRGVYVCEINTTGFKPVDSRQYKVTVIEKLKFTPRPISKKLELGTAAKIPCKAQGSPTPLVRWLKERVPSHPLPPHVHDINGTLHFDTVYSTDKGKYICIATSTQGTINATVDIDVIVAPRFTITPENPTEAFEGYSVMLHCMASGDPMPTIKWDKNGEMNGLDAQRIQIFENGSLLLRYISEADKGIYGCTAGNSGGLKREEALLVVKGLDGYQPNDGSDSDDSMMTKTVTITLSAAVAYMILVIGLMVWCRYRRRKRKEAYLNASPENILLAKTENGDAAIMNGEKQDNKEPKRENGRKSDGTETTHSQSSAMSKKSSKSNQYEKLTFSRQNLSDLRLIGHGIFGQVFVGKTTNMTPVPVIVKSLQNIRSENCLVEFKRETDMFHRLSHDNVAKLFGLCREADPHYMILEFTDWGELKNFLQTTKKERSKLSLHQTLDIAKQISLGMEHLSNARFVHKDLAARNCIISSDFKVKVSLIGLSKDVYSNDYSIYCNRLLPLRWQPHEVVFDDDYSTKSDVYSFAALCSELFHQGDQPFHSLPDTTVIEKLQHQELILKPSRSAPPKVAGLLLNCASYNPRERPTFSTIAITLGESLKDV